MFSAQVGLLDPDNGPVLDDSWPTVVRTEVRENQFILSLLSSYFFDRIKNQLILSKCTWREN